jgi:hypothetical protein
MHLVIFTYLFTYTYRFVQYQDRGSNRKRLHLGLCEQPTLKLPESTICYRTKEQLIRRCNYSMTFGGSRASEEGRSDASEFEATLTKGQRASVWPSLRPTSCSEPSSSSSGSSLGKCDRAATSVDRVPHQTPLVAATLTRFSTSSAAMTRDIANDDDPLASPSIKSRTNAADVRRASSSASAWRRSANVASSHSATSSR